MSSRTVHILAAAALVAAAAVRLYALSAASFELEEIATVDAAEHARGILDAQASTATVAATPDPVEPVPVLVSVLALRSGYGEFTQRLPGVVAGIATVAAIHSLASTLFGAEVALYAAIGMACSPVHVALSRTVGPGVWLALFATLSTAAFVRALWSGGRLQQWIAFGACALLMCGSGYAALFPLAGMAGYAVAALRQRELRTAALRGCIACSGVAALAAASIMLQPPHPEPSIFALRLGPQLPAEIASMLATGRGGTLAGGALMLLCVLIGALSAAHKRGAGLCGVWLLCALLGTVLVDRYLGLQLRAGQLAVALPAYFVLMGAGMSWSRQVLARMGRGRIDALVRSGFLCLLVAVEAPSLWAYLRQPPAPWREAAAVVDANARSSDSIVVLNDRRRFLFYAPDLERRAAGVARPGLAPVFFVHPFRAWFVAPAASRLYPGWKRVAEWFQRFPPVRLSPGPGVDVFYVGRGGRAELLREAAYFHLPTAVLVRDSLLLELLKQSGPIPPVLWKVDQIALSREALDFHNPQLLSVVDYLAQQGFGDRAISLAYRLATADPNWAEARQALDDLGGPAAKRQ